MSKLPKAAAIKSVVLQPPAEILYADELARMVQMDTGFCPPNWKLSTRAVVNFLMGDEANGISPKYVGKRSVIEDCVVTLATDRALHLSGVPGTAKSKISEWLAAAVSGNSRFIVQGTAGTDETALRYSWNYAMMLSKGCVPEALIPSPVMRAMTLGGIVRIEEMTRMPSEVMDALLSPLQEKSISVPELDMEFQAVEGFSCISTSNDRDVGVNEMSSALRRRFNTVVLSPPETIEQEIHIVRLGVAKLAKLPGTVRVKGVDEHLMRVVTIFRELRSGLSEDRRSKVKTVSGSMSTAEAISIINKGMAMASEFSTDGMMKASDYIRGVKSAAVQNHGSDADAWKDYINTRTRERWPDLYRAAQDI